MKIKLTLLFIALSCAAVSGDPIYSNITGSYPGSSSNGYGANGPGYIGTTFTSYGPQGNLSSILIGVLASNSLPFTVGCTPLRRVNREC